MRNKGVTESVLVPVLVPATPEEREGIANFLKGFEGLASPVRRLTEDDLDPSTARGKATWNSLASDQQERFVDLVKLLEGLRKKDQKAIRTAYLRLFARSTSVNFKRLIENLPDEYSFSTDVLAEALGDSMKNLQLVLWRNAKKFTPALFCRDFATAFYLRVLLDAVGNPTFAICPRCLKPFLRRRPDQVYCSRAHGAGARVTKSRRTKRLQSNRP